MKPHLVILVSALSILIVVEVILLKTDLLSRRWRSSEQGWSPRRNRNVGLTLIWLLRIYKALGFNFKPSSTIREVTSNLAGNLQDQSETLTFITRSLEKHIYGGLEIESGDLIYYSKWITFAKTYVKSR